MQRTAVHQLLRAPGQPLDTPLREEMEARLGGADFSDVRLHTDTTAQRSAAEVGARAYTSGNHIVIGAGGADRHTMAHELTHVLQQRQGPVAGTPTADGLAVSDPADRFEREAEATAAAVLSTSASVPPSPPGPVPRAGWSAARPVQRDVTAKIPQPDVAERSEVVPDLPATLVQQIQAARTSNQRKQILGALTNYVWTQLRTENNQDLQDLQARVKPTYVHSAGPSNSLAITKEQLDEGDPDRPPISLSIYRGAFDRGPAVLYSVLRHELIHAKQRSMVPDAGAASDTDKFMFENLYPPDDLGPDTRYTLQLPL
ncbi:eCIS core domain-containing protein [Saccharopolyspora shandongensis]|uniref:eCIS core domain-containing protein n=1 Tax=Saccharopolyspora shandongensis TaxID=418495 RepID=UPI0033D79818